MFSFFRNRRRRKLLADPFPPWWEATLRRNVAHYPRLSPAEQGRLRDATRVLVAEKRWEGCAGFFVTEEVKVTVAAQAALLLLGMDHDYYARVSSVVVYPNSFLTPNPEDDWEDDQLSDTVLSGQAVYRGPVIVSWEEAVREGRDPAAGHNVVVHEFAHQLDFLDGLTDGTPDLPAALAERWAAVMTAALESHRKAVDRGEETFFSEGAAENEAEFFADASEAFVCLPADFRAEHPDVYNLLRDYYRVDPVRWFPEDAGE